MENLIIGLAGVGALAILVTAYMIYRWVGRVNGKAEGFEAWLESHDERLDKIWERFYKADKNWEDLDDRVDGLESLMSDQIMDKIKKK